VEKGCKTKIKIGQKLTLKVVSDFTILILFLFYGNL